MNAYYNVKKNYHNLIVFNTCRTLIYHNGCLEKIFLTKISINGGLHSNISFYREIGTNMHKSITNWIHFHFTAALSQCYNYKK